MVCTMRYLKPDLLGALAGAYVLGTLSMRTRRRFERLMKAHPSIAQAVREWEKRLMPLASAVPLVTPPARVWRAIDRRLGPMPAQVSGAKWFAELISVAQPVRWALATQTLAIVVLTVALIFTFVERPQFETFSSPPPNTATAGHLRLVFSASTTEKTIRVLLKNIDGTIVHGPDDMGVYTVALSDPTSLPRALRMLQRHPHIKLVLPVSHLPTESTP